MTDPEVTTLAAEGDPDEHEGPGGGLANFLYPEPAARDSLSIIKWWEFLYKYGLQCESCWTR